MTVVCESVGILLAKDLPINFVTIGLSIRGLVVKYRDPSDFARHAKPFASV